jgi:hypothetical protein
MQSKQMNEIRSGNGALGFVSVTEQDEWQSGQEAITSSK